MAEPGSPVGGVVRPEPLASALLGSVSVLDAALAYVGRSWAVLPLHSVSDGQCTCGKLDCRSPGKHPRTQNGLKDATRAPDIVREWFARWPGANIGIATGAISGIVVLDVDGPEGEKAVDGLGWNAPTPTSLTGKGRHLLFRHPGNPIQNTVRLREELDVRGDGGYIVAPPSVHRSGIRYQWDEATNLGFDLDPAPLPDSLRIELLAANRRSVEPAVEWRGIPEGKRNDALTRYAGSVLGRGASEAETLRLCLALNSTSCTPPLPVAEVARTVRSISAREKAKREPYSDPDPPSWPARLAPEALCGLAGDVVRLIAPHSEADEAALLIQFHVAFGNSIGRGPHFVVEADRHGMNLFALLLGMTSKGRKGTSWGQIARLFSLADPRWLKDQVTTGLSSGEGLIWSVRDPIERLGRGGKAGEKVGETILEDPGIQDKRLLVIEPEFASTMKVLGREGNTLSATLRQSWDSGTLRVMNKNSPVRATDAHISIVGHITSDELLRHLTQTDVANGFLNRFLLVCVRRSKFLPEGGSLREEELGSMASILKEALAIAGSVGLMGRDTEARELWYQIYPSLSEGKPGLLGAATSRAEAQVMRLACLYALLDGTHLVRVQHLRAALALWRYVEESSRFTLGDTLGDPVADSLLRELRAQSYGMTRTEIRDHFSGHRGAEVARALASLSAQGLIRQEKEGGTRGRAAERWRATEATKATGKPPSVASVAGQECAEEAALDRLDVTHRPQ